MAIARHPFPTIPWAGFRLGDYSLPAGAFANRIFDAVTMLEFPDLGDGDLSREDRRRGLHVFASELITSRALVEAVVAFEELVRELGRAIESIQELKQWFPSIAQLPIPTSIPSPKAQWSPTERDRHSPLDLDAVAKTYRCVLSVDPIDAGDIPRLRDLILIRHTLSHHGHHVRPQDAPRFVFYDLQAGQELCPEFEFARETIRWVGQVGFDFNRRVALAIFMAVVPTFTPFDPDNPPPVVARLVEAAAWLGQLLQPEDEPPEPAPMFDSPDYPRWLEAAKTHRLERVRRRAIDALLADVAQTPP